MASVEEVKRLLHYYLSELSARNEHHRFEDLCRELAQRTIASNILPATGPVSAGGDQGLDFESFHSYLSRTSLAPRSFVTLANGDLLAFACTVQETKVGTKIRSDVQIIAGADVAPDRVYYFAARNVAVGLRHKLQRWAWKSFGFRLEILDAQAISQLLAEPPFFWIARQYLNVPAEVAPELPPGTEDRWYVEQFAFWSEHSPSASSYGDFELIQAATRFAVHDETKNSDLDFWLQRLEHFRGEGAPSPLVWRAIYEQLRTSLRGRQTLRGREHDARAYFDTLGERIGLSDLQNAWRLLGFCGVALMNGVADFAPDEIRLWHERLVDVIERLLTTEEFPASRCELLELRGYLAAFSAIPGEALDLDRAFQFWLQLTEGVPQAPLYPLDSFNEIITSWAPFVWNHPDYPTLTGHLDRLIGERHGDLKAAEGAQARAEKLHEAGHRLQALDELHRAKVRWFKKEALTACIQSLLLISEIYGELHLHVAAKQYALAAAALAGDSLTSDQFLAPGALLQAAATDFSLGAWANYLALFLCALKSGEAYWPKGSDFSLIPELVSGVQRLGLVMAWTEKVAPDFSKPVVNVLRGWMGRETTNGWLQPFRSALQPINDLDELWEIVAAWIYNDPWSDLNLERAIEWLALGIRWRVTFQNTLEAAAQAEEFIALLQTVLADVAHEDLVLLPTAVHVEIQLQADTVVHVVPPQEDPDSPWRLVLPDSPPATNPTAREQHYNALLGAAIPLLDSISLMSDEQFHSVLEQRVRGGLTAKTFVLRPYSRLLREVISPEDFGQIQRGVHPEPFPRRALPLTEHPDLAWPDEPGPNYSRDTSTALISGRYQRMTPGVRYTIEQLNQTEAFRRLVRELRGEGWKDWHLLLAVGNIALQYRVRDAEFEHLSEGEMLELHVRFMDAPETPDGTIPVGEFTPEAMRGARRAAMLAGLSHYGLQTRPYPIDINAVERLLARRYGYWADDAFHAPLFASGLEG